MADQKKSAIVTARASTSIALPPGSMGFADLVTPKAFGDDPAKFKLDIHYTPAAIEALKAVIEAKCIEPLLAKLHEEVEKNGGKAKPAQSAEEWLEAALKEPKPKSRIQLPFLTIIQKGFRKGRDGGDPIPNTIGCWDAHNESLDLLSLRMAMGTILEPIVYANLWASKPNNWLPKPSLKLVGVRVRKLEQWGGGRGQRPPEADDQAIAAVLGENYEQDLSAYTLAALAPDTSGHGHDEDDDEPAEDKLGKLLGG